MLPKENKTLKRKKEQIEPEMKKMKCENDDLRSELSVSMSQILYSSDEDEEKSENVKESTRVSESECKSVNENSRQINKTFFQKVFPLFFNVIFG